MTMVDTKLHELINSGVIYSDDMTAEALHASVGAISVDLHTLSYTDNESVNMDSWRLEPGESAFVSCKELIRMPNNLVARIVLRNGRIRQGFTLDAPVYQPGHHTRVFFRITNVSGSAIELKQGGEFASIMFEELDREPEQPYSGSFQNEMKYSDIGTYHDAYNADMHRIDDKMDEIKNLEKNIYTNVITLMSIFIALFSLINVNVDIAFAENVEQMRIIVSNLVTIGSISFLVSLIQLCINRKGKRAAWGWILAISLVILGITTALVL